MPSLYEYNITGDDGSGNILGVNWSGQTFTPIFTHTVTSVKLKLLRVGSPGTVTVSIRATSGAGDPLPSGSDLASGTTSGNTLTTGSGGEWREIYLGAGTSLTAGTKYAIVIRATTGDTNNKVMIRLQTTGTYGSGVPDIKGTMCTSSNSGSSWNAVDDDVLFEEWAGSVLAQLTTEAVTAVASTTATGNGTLVSIGASAVTEHGHCWNTAVDPTTANSKTTNGSTGVGVFTSAMTGLTWGTKYFVRAYATNTEGTGYGNGVSFVSGGVSTIKKPGEIAVKTTTFRYVGDNGQEYYVQGIVV